MPSTPSPRADRRISLQDKSGSTKAKETAARPMIALTRETISAGPNFFFPSESCPKNLGHITQKLIY
jgi:hypothetical protein